ncbi:MAG: peptidyl-prolyl cis-trans isomerase [Desulfobulbaceae bacterium]|nr:peptidyl-prolyl cis-trans isomerase [Desulfobulbaceae bacterium]
METTLGTITIELFDDKAPITCANFRTYVKEGFFNGLIFHRVIPGFVIQGGGFEPGMKKRQTHSPIVNEADNGLKNKRGTLSMARTQDIYSATSQFFINVAANASLDHRGKTSAGFGYAVFGKVVGGMDVVDKIVATPTGTSGYYRDVPKTDVVMTKVYEKK